MTTAATIAARLTLDKSDYDSGLGAAGKSADTFQANMKNVGQSMTRVGGMMTASLTVPIVAGFGMIVKSASDLNESTNAMTVVFGEGSDAIKEFGEQSATTVGLAKNDWFQLSAMTGASLKNLGMSQREAGDETIKLTERASDLASIFNTDVNDAMQAVQSMMRGEQEPIRKYGVSLNEASIQAKAMSMGLVQTDVNMTKVNGILLQGEEIQRNYAKAVKKYGADSLEARKIAQDYAETEDALAEAMKGSKAQLTQQQKATASLALFYEQTAQFAGDFKNTSDQLANSSRILKAQLTDEAAALGTQLLPYALKAITFFRELITKFQQLSPEQQKWIMILVACAAALGPLLMILGTVVTTISALIPVITAVAGLFTFPLIAIILAVIAVMALLYLAWQNNWGGIREFTAEAIQWISDFIADAMQFISDLTSGKLGEMSAIWDRTTSAIKTVVSLLFANLKLLFQAFQAAFSGDWRRFGEILRQMWDNLWKGLTVIVKTAWANIQSLVKVAIDSLMSWFAGVNWSQVGTNIVVGIANGLLGALPILLRAGASIYKALSNFLAGFFGGAGSNPTTATPGAGTGIGSGYIYASGTNGWQTVPSGYPNDTFPARMSSGERFAVVPKGENLPTSGSGTVNYFNPQITIITGKSDPKKAMKGFT